MRYYPANYFPANFAPRNYWAGELEPVPPIEAVPPSVYGGGGGGGYSWAPNPYSLDPTLDLGADNPQDTEVVLTVITTFLTTIYK